MYPFPPTSSNFAADGFMGIHLYHFVFFFFQKETLLLSFKKWEKNDQNSWEVHTLGTSTINVATLKKWTHIGLM